MSEPPRTIGHDDYCGSNNYDPGDPEYAEQCDCHWRFFVGMDPSVVQEMVEFVEGLTSPCWDEDQIEAIRDDARAIIAKLEASKEEKK